MFGCYDVYLCKKLCFCVNVSFVQDEEVWVCDEIELFDIGVMICVDLDVVYLCQGELGFYRWCIVLLECGCVVFWCYLLGLGKVVYGWVYVWVIGQV